ncbi:unnamed protein product, partial [Mesorhabditis spiculigera]
MSDPLQPTPPVQTVQHQILDVAAAAAKIREFRRKIANGMTQIIPDLYLGSLRDARDEDQLKRYKIKRVVSIHKHNSYCQVHEALGINVLQIEIDDLASCPISEHFQQTVLFIHHSRIAKEPVLVHCMAGVSRSATIVAAYLCTITKISAFNSLAHITNLRPVVNPNFGFRLQLAQYADREAHHRFESIKDTCDQELFDAQLVLDNAALKHRIDLFIPPTPMSLN